MTILVIFCPILRQISSHPTSILYFFSNPKGSWASENISEKKIQVSKLAGSGLKHFFGNSYPLQKISPNP